MESVPGGTKMQVLLVDDHPVILEIMPAVIRRAIERAEVLIEATLEGALERVRVAQGIGFAVLDLGLPGCTGVDAPCKFRKAAPKIPFVVISAAEDGETIRSAFAAGARGYLPKTLAIPLMVSAIQFVRQGGTYVPAAAMAGNPRDSLIDENSAQRGVGRGKFTDRQLDVLRGLARGMANREIARELDISENTVKQHAKDIFRMLGVSNRTEACVVATRRGIGVD